MIYDYIIVGAGSAGCVLAHRLSTDANIRVLLLEAGKRDRQLAIHIPAGFSQVFHSELDWNYYTEPQAHMNQRQLYWPRGKVLGGSSSINAMIYIRGHQQDYDNWAKLGNFGWGFSDLLPYFKKAENYQVSTGELYGTRGLLNVESLRDKNILSRAFVEAGVEMGLQRREDLNHPEAEGVGFYPVTQKQGRRHSAAAAYLSPCRDRKNLQIRTETLVTRLLFEGTRVVGVEFVGPGGKCDRAYSNREVILAGGAINSPQLLMLSGIGDRDRLQSLNIPVVVHLPGVGENLQDHLIAGVVYQCKQPISLDKANTAANWLQYLLFKRGPLTSNIAEAGGFVKTQSDLLQPDIQFHFAPLYFLEHGLQKPRGHGFSLGATLLHPESRGSIRLASSSAFDAPRIQPNYLAREADLRVLSAGIKLCRNILQASPFDRFRGAEVFPGSECQEEEEIAEFIRNSAETLYHPAGTCKMGTDSLAVVNSRLQVYGVDNLRVVDASIMPAVVGGNTHAPTVAIAEKAADLLRSNY